jgi:hypothetical protein
VLPISVKRWALPEQDTNSRKNKADKTDNIFIGVFFSKNIKHLFMPEVFNAKNKKPPHIAMVLLLLKSKSEQW